MKNAIINQGEQTENLSSWANNEHEVFARNICEKFLFNLQSQKDK